MFIKCHYLSANKLHSNTRKIDKLLACNDYQNDMSLAPID